MAKREWTPALSMPMRANIGFGIMTQEEFDKIVSEYSD